MNQFILINDCQVPIEFKIVLEENNLSVDSEIKFEPDQGIVDAYTNQPISVRNKIQFY